MYGIKALSQQKTALIKSLNILACKTWVNECLISIVDRPHQHVNLSLSGLISLCSAISVQIEQRVYLLRLCIGKSLASPNIALSHSLALVTSSLDVRSGLLFPLIIFHYSSV
jgi:hypothetical protein